MKKYFGLFFLLILLNTTPVLAGIEIDKTNFPNAAFRNLISQFDLNRDGFLIPDEIALVTEIDCQKNAAITDLTGIELFTSLKSLSCWMCPVKKLDVSNNTKLEYLDCCETSLTALNVTSNPNLKQLWCYGNSFKSLDLQKCPYLIKAVNNGVYNNNKNDGTACSYADDGTDAYLVVDKNITLRLSSTKTVIAGTGASGSGSGSGSGSSSGSGSGSSTGGSTESEEETYSGIGGIASPAHKSSYTLGSTVPIDIRPTGSISLGGISISGTIQIKLDGTVKYSKSVSASGTAGSIKDSYTPDKAGTYRIVVSLDYKLSGMVIQHSAYGRVFYVTVPECAAHSYGAWKVIKKATYTATGTKQRTCTVCGHVETATISKLQVKAGTVLKNSSASYKVLSGLKTVSYKAPVKKTAASVSVPAAVKLAGKTYKVTAIEAKAFSGCTKMTQLTIGKNVKTIGASAFSGCKALKTATLGQSVTTIGQKAFYNCSALKKITIQSKSLKTVGAKALYKINAKAVIEVPASKKNAYAKLLKGKGQGVGVKIKELS